MNFSIIIPALNEEQTIVNCLIPLQDLRTNSEVILVDGGSTDNTVQLAQHLVDQLISSNKGRALQMNAGAQSATGEILIFLHADTRLPPHALELINQSMSLYQQWGRFNIVLSGKHPFLKIVALFMNWRSRLTGIATGDQVIFVNKQLFDKTEHYPSIPLMEDIALCKKLKKFSPPICIKAKVISSGRRWEQFGVIKTILLMWTLRLRYFFGADPRLLSYLYHRGQFWKT